MADVTTNALRGITKTLDDVVAAAIPADDPLALQELKLVVRYLNFTRERIEHLHARARFELAFQADLLAEAQGLDPALGRELAPLQDRAKAMLADPAAATRRIRELGQEIASRISGLLGEVTEPPLLSALERAVVKASERIIAFERSWYVPLKLERFPEQLRPLGSFIPT